MFAHTVLGGFQAGHTDVKDPALSDAVLTVRLMSAHACSTSSTSVVCYTNTSWRKPGPSSTTGHMMSPVHGSGTSCLQNWNW